MTSVSRPSNGMLTVVCFATATCSHLKMMAPIKLTENGRKTPFYTGCRPLFNFINNMKTSGQINLIHQDDCIGIITTIINKGLDHYENSDFNATFNAVNPFHPSRKEYYTQKAIEFHLPLPEFNENKSSVGKLVTSVKAETILNYTFKKKL